MISQNKINILHIVEDASSETGGGISTVVKILTNGIKSESVQQEIVCNIAPEESSSIITKTTVFKKSDFLGWIFKRIKIFFLRNLKNQYNFSYSWNMESNSIFCCQISNQ